MLHCIYKAKNTGMPFFVWKKRIWPRAHILLIWPNSDQHQISPCAYSTSEVMRNKDMITQGEF